MKIAYVTVATGAIVSAQVLDTEQPRRSVVNGIAPLCAAIYRQTESTEEPEPIVVIPFGSSLTSMAFAAVSGMCRMVGAPKIEHKSRMVRLGVQDPEHGTHLFRSVAMLTADAEDPTDLMEIIENSIEFLPKHRAKQVIKGSGALVESLMSLRPIIAVTTFAFPNYLDAQDAIAMDELTKEMGLYFLTLTGHMPCSTRLFQN